MSLTRLRYHYIWSTKFRKPLITPEVERVIECSTIASAKELGIAVIEQNGYVEHRHLILAVPPTIAVSDVARRIKSDTTKAVRKTLGLDEFRWQVGFACFTLNAFNFADTCQYVREQKKRHRQGKLIESFELLADDEP